MTTGQSEKTSTSIASHVIDSDLMSQGKEYFSRLKILILAQLEAIFRHRNPNFNEPNNAKFIAELLMEDLGKLDIFCKKCKVKVHILEPNEKSSLIHHSIYTVIHTQSSQYSNITIGPASTDDIGKRIRLPQGLGYIDCSGQDGFANDKLFSRAISGKVATYIDSFNLVVGAKGTIQSFLDDTVAAVEKASTDELTGLGNRYGLNQFIMGLQGWIHLNAESVSEENKKIGLMVLDIDHFKRVNDTLGHLFGDEVLAGFARSMREFFGNNDIKAKYPGIDVHIFRLGGEEFCIIIQGLVIQNQMEEIGEQLRAHLENTKYLLSPEHLKTIAEKNNNTKELIRATRMRQLMLLRRHKPPRNTRKILERMRSAMILPATPLGGKDVLGEIGKWLKRTSSIGMTLIDMNDVLRKGSNYINFAIGIADRALYDAKATRNAAVLIPTLPDESGYEEFIQKKNTRLKDRSRRVRRMRDRRKTK